MKRNLFALWFLTLACAVLCAGGTGDSTSPVPEPGSLILLGTAAAGIGYVAWRRKRNK